MIHDRPAPLDPAAASAESLARFDRGFVQFLLLAVIALILVIAALDHARTIAVPTVLAVLAAIALAPVARRLERQRAPPSLAAAVIVAGILISTAGTIYALLPSAEAWNARAPQVIREVERRMRDISTAFTESISDTPRAVPEAEAPPTATTAPETETETETDEPSSDAIDQLVDSGQRMVADWAIGAPRIVGGAVYWAVLTFFLLRDRAMLGRRLMGLGPGMSARRALHRAMSDVQNDVARFLLAITMVNFALGCCVAGAFFLLGVPNAPLWGVAAGLLNFMPFIGAAIMALVTLGVGLVSFEDPLVAFAPLAVVLVLNTVEGQFVTPMVLGARMRLPTIGIFLSIAFGAWLWGAAGALAATPTLIVATAFVTRLNAVRMKTLPPPQDGLQQRPGPS